MNKIAIVVMTGILTGSACTTEPVDPTGFWSFTGQYGTGNCPLLEDELVERAFNVINGPSDSYQLLGFEPNQEIIGNMACNTAGCTLSAVETLTVITTVQFKFNWNLELTPNDKIVGSGSFQAEDCSQVIVNISGSKS